MDHTGHWERVKTIFTRALEQPPGYREGFVRDACAADAGLLADVLKLLACYDQGTGTLSQPLFPLSGSLLDQPPQFSPEMVVANRFRIGRLIARGGMGEIYEAEDLRLGVRVALKTIRSGLAADERILELFKNEIQTARRVTHPNVCRIYDLAEHHAPETSGTDAITVFLTMELLTGVTLSEHLKAHGPLSPKEALRLVRQIVSALDAAHEAGVIHRDLKPGNVMLTADGNGNVRAVVTDFGLAVARMDSASGFLAGTRGGTPDYMAPEQLTGQPVTPATDIYAMGLVIAEMIGAEVGRVPVSPPSGPDQRITIGDRVLVSLPKKFSRWEHIILRCLHSDPEERYQRPAAVADVLEYTERRYAALSRPRVLATAAGLALLGLTAVVAQQYNRWHLSRPTVYRKLGAEEENLSLWRPSLDGRYFAVTDWRTGNLGLRDVSTGDVRLVTHRAKSPAEGQAISAIFSPDGNQIAYSWFQNRSFQLRIVDIRSGQDRLLHEDPELVYCHVADWSPDGSRILSHFVGRDHTGRIAVVFVATGSVSFPLPEGDYGDAVFAPDSAGIVYSTPNASKTIEQDIREVSIRGGPAADLVKDPADDRVIAFSPNGRKLIFSSDRKGTYGVWAIDYPVRSAEEKPEMLANDLGRASAIGLDHEGTLYYRVATNSLDVYTAEIDAAEGRLLSGPDNVVKRFRGAFRFPSWSADGRRLSFVSLLDGRQRIWIYSRDTGAFQAVEVKLADFQRPQFDPVSDRIFVTGTDANGQSGIFRVDPNTGDAELVIDSKRLDGNEGVWARDGRTLFDRFTDYRLGLFRIDVATGRRQRLYVPPIALSLALENLALSPDQRTLAFLAQQPQTGVSTLMLTPAEGGPARPLLTITRPERFSFGAFAWTTDSSKLLAARLRGNAGELWLIPVDGSTPQKIDFPNMPVRQLRLSPDGRTIAFTSGEASGEIWAAENLLPKY